MAEEQGDSSQETHLGATHNAWDISVKKDTILGLPID